MSNLTFKTALGGSIGEGHGTSAYGGGGVQIVNNLTDFHIQYSKAAADSMASDATANTAFWMNPYDFTVRIYAASLLPTATLTAHDTNYAQISIKTDDGAGGTPATALLWETKITAGTGNWAVGVKEAPTTTTLTACNIVAGGCAWFNIAKQGSGVVVGISHYIIRVTKLG